MLTSADSIIASAIPAVKAVPLSAYSSYFFSYFFLLLSLYSPIKALQIAVPVLYFSCLKNVKSEVNTWTGVIVAGKKWAIPSCGVCTHPYVSDPHTSASPIAGSGSMELLPVLDAAGTLIAGQWAFFALFGEHTG